MPKQPPTDIDRLIGRRIRKRRKALGLSLAALGAVLGVTYQQVQKYEAGSNRISAAQLVSLAETLDVPSGYFLERTGE